MQFSRAIKPAGSHAVLLSCLVIASLVLACTEPGPSIRPTGSPGGSNPPASFGGSTTPAPLRTPSGTASSWPTGWDTSFCAAFAEVVIAQELAVDVERAIKEEANDDAEALAAELRDTAAHAGELLAAVPAWTTGQDALGEMTSLMDAGRRAGEQYFRYLSEGRRRSLTRARELRDEIRDTVPTAMEAINLLIDEGLDCPGQVLDLESP